MLRLIGVKEGNNEVKKAVKVTVTKVLDGNAEVRKAVRL